jgi:hypothetical protein
MQVRPIATAISCVRMHSCKLTVLALSALAAVNRVKDLAHDYVVKCVLMKYDVEEKVVRKYKNE